MHNIQAFDVLKLGFTKCNIDVFNYLINPTLTRKETTNEQTGDGDEIKEELREALKEPPCTVKWPKININGYLNDTDLKLLISIIDKKDEIRKFIDKRIVKTCKEPSRTVFKELMYNVVKFSNNKEFNVKQLGAILSQFYITHIYFTSSYNMDSEKLYLFFKESMMCHTIASPPESLNIFTTNESKEIMKFFCKIYLNNLPLIRVLCLPNFAFQLNTQIEVPEPLPEHPKNKKEKKPKKGGKKKKK